MDKKPKNGGFPPIEYCLEKVIANQKNFKKERLFSSNIGKNINIRKILKKNISKPVIDIDNEPEKIDIVENI